MKFSIIYEIGKGPEEADEEEFPDRQAAKLFAATSLKMKLTMSSAASGSVSVGEVEGPELGDVEWLGAYDCERGGEPVWTEDDE